MIVDDRAAVRSTIQQTLERSGFRTISAVSVESAQNLIASLDSQFFDLVVSDVLLPGLSGVDFAQWLDKHLPNVPVALLSGTPVENSNILPPQTLVIQKPIDPEQLLAKLTDLLSTERDDYAAPIAKGA